MTCVLCQKENDTCNVSVLNICDDCLFVEQFKEPHKIKEMLADELEQEGDMLMENDNKELQRVGEKLKLYAIVVEKLVV